MSRLRRTIVAFMCVISLCSCGQVEERESKLNNWQINLLEAMELPTEYELLTTSQQRTINRVWDMISYLNTKYEEEFIYVDYIPKELNQTETLYAYPKSTGSGNGKYYVTVKANGEGFTDNYFDFSVSSLAEELTNEFLAEHFDSDEYKYFALPLACSVDMAEMENGKFQWKYGASNRIFLLESECSIENVEEFAVEYAKWLYEHELSGTHRIQILSEFPEDEEFGADNGGYIYSNYDKLCTGFYSFHAKPSKRTPNKYYTIYVKYDPDSDWHLGEIFHISTEYAIEDYFSKY